MKKNTKTNNGNKPMKTTTEYRQNEKNTQNSVIEASMKTVPPGPVLGQPILLCFIAPALLKGRKMKHPLKADLLDKSLCTFSRHGARDSRIIYHFILLKKFGKHLEKLKEI